LQLLQRFRKFLLRIETKPVAVDGKCVELFILVLTVLSLVIMVALILVMTAYDHTPSVAATVNGLRTRGH
jgi:hypothetical protein